LSSTGQYQVAVASEGYIFYSSDYGVTWIQQTSGASSTDDFVSVSISDNGDYISAITSKGNIYKSTPTLSTISSWTGGVAIGKSSVTSGYALDVSGNVTVSGGITGPTGSFTYLLASTGTFSYVSSTIFNATSDYRLKENVKKININDYSVDNINPVYFKFKDTQRENLGVIAHELQEYYPFLVEGNKDGNTLQSVNYVGLIPVLIKEIQELKREIKEIKEELNKIK
jgi:hypothetical protein